MRIYQQRLLWLIGLVSIIKLVVAGSMELGNDEVYYWTYALQPDWNHFDHPPMVGLLIRLSTFNLLLVNDITMRLGAIICSGLAAWLLYRTGDSLAHERTGWYAALIYLTAVYSSIIAGLFIMPDSPQVLFWVWALYLMARLIEQDGKGNWYWLLLGLAIGLATLSKVHGLYLWAGFGLFILISRRSWLKEWALYVGVLITLACIVPIVYWNYANDFITYKFHSERVTHTSLQWDMLLREVLGEFAYQNPVVFVAIVLAMLRIKQLKDRFLFNDVWVWICCMSIPMILLFWGVALFNPTLPHWAGPAYIPLYLLAGLYLDSISQYVYPLLIRLAGGLVAFLLLVALLLVNFAPMNFGSQDSERYGEYCPTLDISGWKDLGKQMKTLVKQDIEDGRMPPDAALISHKWFPAGHLEFYVSKQMGKQLIGAGPLQDIHKFAWLNQTRPQLKLGQDAYCIIPSNIPLKIMDLYGKNFRSIDIPSVIKQKRGGKDVRYFYVYRMHECIALPQMGF